MELHKEEEKTVEAWEEGVNNPSGPACRILELINQDILSMDQYIIT